MSTSNDLELSEHEIKSLCNNPFALAQLVHYHHIQINEVESIIEDTTLMHNIIAVHLDRIEELKKKIGGLLWDYGIENLSELGL